MASAIYWISVGVVLFVFIVLVWTVLHLIFGKETESPESKELKGIRKGLKEVAKQLKDIKEEFGDKGKGNADKK